MENVIYLIAVFAVPVTLFFVLRYEAAANKAAPIKPLY